MTEVKRIYEQVEQSGLYRLAGECRGGTFHRATGRRELKTLAQWTSLPVQGPQPPRAPTPVVHVWQELTDAAKSYLTRRAQSKPVVEPGSYWAGVPAAPQTLDLVVTMQQHLR
jgi:hypothetical protein